MGKKYYKVVNDDLCSAIGGLPKDYRIQYKLNEFVEGHKGTPIFIFESQKKAQNFIHGLSRYRIYECEAKNVRNVRYVCSCWGYFYFDKFYKAKKTHKKLPYAEYAPVGSRIADSVKLIKRVY